MKRLILMSFLLTLVCAASARAETWFPDGWTLHQDPLCIHNDFSLESCYAKTLTMTAAEAEAQSYLICGKCYADPPAAPAAATVSWYSNPDGGAYLHRDPECPSVARKYRPLTLADTLHVGVIPSLACSICGDMTTTGAYPIEYLFDNTVWNSTPEEKALMLPGVWTLPSEDGIPFTEAMEIAKAWTAQYSDSTVYSAFACHYDKDPWWNPGETWQVVVSTPLLHPVCIVHIDALTGEVLGGQLSREYSDRAVDTESR